MELRKNNMPVGQYLPSYVGKRIIIGIDSSKSNTAIVVGDEFKEILDDYEIRGGGSDVDVYQLAWETRIALKSLFDGAEVIAVGLENIITKSSDNNKGLNIHQSRAKITAVFDNLIFYFQEYHNIMPTLINNQEWKSHTLPEEYRKRTHDKGSKDYFDDLGGRWAGRKDDVTDAVCIFTYLCSTLTVDVVHDIVGVNATTRKYDYLIFPTSLKLPPRTMEFRYNNKYTLLQNIETCASLITSGVNLACIHTPVEALSIEDFYSGRLQSRFPKEVKEVNIIVEVK